MRENVSIVVQFGPEPEKEAAVECKHFHRPEFFAVSVEVGNIQVSFYFRTKEEIDKFFQVVANTIKNPEEIR